MALSREEARALGEASKIIRLLGIERNKAGSDPWSKLVIDSPPTNGKAKSITNGNAAILDAAPAATATPPTKPASTFTKTSESTDAAPEPQEGEQ